MNLHTCIHTCIHTHRHTQAIKYTYIHAHTHTHRSEPDAGTDVLSMRTRAEKIQGGAAYEISGTVSDYVFQRINYHEAS